LARRRGIACWKRIPDRLVEQVLDVHRAFVTERQRALAIPFDATRVAHGRLYTWCEDFEHPLIESIAGSR
jgi:hypothetical protein